jgi:8-oxo-dGTP diphosphatase
MENSIVILTNMVMVYRGDGKMLVQRRLKHDWPGLNFPGGHVERGESIPGSAAREMKEETGLTVKDLECVGYYEWNIPKDGVRHLAILFRTDKFEGDLKDSGEGPVFWADRAEMAAYEKSADFDEILAIMTKGLNL